LVFKSSGVVGLIYVNFAKVGFLLKFILNGKSKLDRRIPDRETLEQETTAWYTQRNHSQKS
jgi:hypothetical protein